MDSIQEPRILLLDFYDSFTYNLSSLLRASTGAVVDVVPHDHYSTLSDLEADLVYYDAVVIGPGPGSPDDIADIGVAKALWTSLPDSSLLPIFGVCLGLQSLCIAYGGQLKKLRVVKHGIISEVTHVGQDIFTGVGQVKAVRYHSLHVDMLGDGSKIQTLAWTTDEGENGQVLMAAKHVTRPYWAVQYHPESICTEGGGDSVVRNWWKLAQQWNATHRRSLRRPELRSRRQSKRPLSLLKSAIQRKRGEKDINDISISENGIVSYTTIVAPQLHPTQICESLGAENERNQFLFLDSAAAPGRYSIIGVLSNESSQIIRYHATDRHLQMSTLGESLQILKKVDLSFGVSIWEYLAQFMSNRRVGGSGGPQESPFWGGLIGYISYEMGVNSLDLPVQPRIRGRPDIQLIYLQRSIAIDTWSGTVYIQTLRDADHGWLDEMKAKLQLAADMAMTPSPTPPLNARSGGAIEKALSCPSQLADALEKATKPSDTVTVIRPQKEKYIEDIHQCQRYLAEGHSYELCLTALTQIHLPSPPPSPWALFTNLRSRNPAPYSAYMKLLDVTIVSSSPERFLSWSREGVCQLRPIKGTVKRNSTTTLEYAKSILHAQKEMAENLMIVDLIRHDLHQLAHEGSVTVRKLMRIEEYKTVYQLVSVIEGTVGTYDSIDSHDETTHSSGGRESSQVPSQSAPVTGFDVLARSLPPGSMTGAPKKRSVQLLAGMEDEERGIYSGVMGYWSVCGAGDWSVTIRTAFKYDDENEEGAESANLGSSQPANTNKKPEIWRIGAGGAITALSDPEEEWDEMEVKLGKSTAAFYIGRRARLTIVPESALRAFIG